MPVTAALGAPPVDPPVTEEPSCSTQSVPPPATDTAPTLTTARHVLGPRIPQLEAPRTQTPTADATRFHRPFSTSPPASVAPPPGFPVGFQGSPSSPVSGYQPHGYMPASTGTMDQKEAGLGATGSPRPSYPVPAGMYMGPGGYFPLLPPGPGSAMPYSGLSSIPGVSIPAAVSVATGSPPTDGVPQPHLEQGSPSPNWQQSLNPAAIAATSPPDKPLAFPASHALPQMPTQPNSRWEQGSQQGNTQQEPLLLTKLNSCCAEFISGIIWISRWLNANYT